MILFEGILSFYDKELLSLMDMKIYVDADADIRLARRRKRRASARALPSPLHSSLHLSRILSALDKIPAGGKLGEISQKEAVT